MEINKKITLEFYEINLYKVVFRSLIISQNLLEEPIPAWGSEFYGFQDHTKDLRAKIIPELFLFFLFIYL